MGFGDSIASFPVIRFIIDNYTKNHDFNFWVPTFCKDLAKFCFPEAKIFGLDEQSKWRSAPTLTTMVDYPTYLRQHLTDYAAALGADVFLKPEQKNYVKPDISLHKYSKECRDYVSVLKNIKYIIITTMFTSDTRVFKAREVNKITKWCSENGILPVFCGKESATHSETLSIKGKNDEGLDYSIGLNLLNKTSLLDFVKLCTDAECVIGVDNGLLHLACMTDAYVIGGYTTVHPIHRLPYRHNQMGWNYEVVIPDESLKCRFCQSNWAFDVDQNFTKCFYKDNGYDTVIRCTKQITGEKFIKLLEAKL